MKRTKLLLLAVMMICAVSFTGCGANKAAGQNEGTVAENAGDDTGSQEEADSASGEENTDEADSADAAENTGGDSTDSTEDAEESGETEEAEYVPADFLNDNASYFVIIDGQKFTAGDKIAALADLGYNPDEDVVAEEVPAKTYTIGGGTMYNAEGNGIFSVTPYNDSDTPVTLADAVIGGISFDNIDSTTEPRKANVNDFEVYGGIKFGSTEEEVKSIFGEPSYVYEGDLGNTISYDSDEIYRSYKFAFDLEGKLYSIDWQNLVFSES